MAQDNASAGPEDAMNKSEQREVDRAVGLLKAGLIEPAHAASSIATLHRSAMTKRSQSELLQVIESNGLAQHLRVVNGCYVPKAVMQ